MKRAVLFIAIVFFLLSLMGWAGAAVEKNAAPGAPGDLKLVIVPNVGFKLSWKPSSDDPGAVTGYEIVRADLASGPFTVVATVGKGVSQYVDTTAAPEIRYYYRVRAMAGNEYSPDSNTVNGER